MSLWVYATHLYGQPGVAKECLSLQDRFNVNINVLLLCLYAGSEVGVTLSDKDIDAAQRATLEWDIQVVRPLRKVRRLLKHRSVESAGSSIESLYTEVKRVELESERIEVMILQEWFDARLMDFAREARDAAVFANSRAALTYYGAEDPAELPQRLLEQALSQHRPAVNSRAQSP